MERIYFKYMSAKGLRYLFDDDVWKLRFSQPSALNDPFEMPLFRKHLTRLEKISGESAEITHQFGQTGGPVLGASGKQTIESSARSLAESGNLSLMSYWNPWLRAIEMHEPRADADVDIDKIVQKVDREFGLLSLTRTRTNLLMWAHYADEHRGAVIAIDVDDPQFSYADEKRGPVDYRSFRPQVAADEEVMLKHFFYKSDDWRYEDEYRIVRRFPSPPTETDLQGRPMYRFELPPSALRVITFGARASPETIGDAWARLKQRNATDHVVIERAVIDERRFGIGFEVISTLKLEGLAAQHA
jgi:hypothetical protein